jgi:UrcA family protein
MKFVTLVSLATLSVGGLVSAQAQDLNVPKQKISFADLNLSSSAGQTALYHRLKAAAVQVCGGFGETYNSPISWTQNVDRCMQTAVIHATATVNVPAFTAYVTSRAPSDQTIRLAKN